MEWIWISKWILILILILIVVFPLHKEHKGVQIENIRAKLILLSTDPKEIEDFLMLKEPYITQELIDLLITRVAELKYDSIIADDDVLKKRIADDDVLKKRIANLEVDDEPLDGFDFGKALLERARQREKREKKS